MRLTALDMETLDTDITNSIIYDVAVVSVDLEFKARKKAAGSTGPLHTVVVTNPHAVTFRFNMLEQMRFGRTSSKETIEFHINRMTGETDEDRFLEFDSHLSDEETQMDVMALLGLDLIREECKKADEIWINGPSFDCSLLATLKTQSGYKHNLWDHRKERDVRSVNRSIPTLNPIKDIRHEAFEDASWNLRVAIAYHELIVRHKLELNLPSLNMVQTMDGWALEGEVSPDGWKEAK